MAISISRVVTDPEAILALDDRLSHRFIELDPFGYFLIQLDPANGELVMEHYRNHVDERGRAIDPETGQVLPCRNGSSRAPAAVFRGRSAKELGIQLTEGKGPHLISRLDHALYLGRELQKAERCLLAGENYVQD